MERTQHTEGEEAMYKRILRKRIVKGLVISLALFAVIPISNAAAKPVSLGQPDPWFQTLVANRTYQRNQFGVTGQELRAMIDRGNGMNKKYGLGQYAFGPTQQELAAMTARGTALNQKYHLGDFAVNSEITTGLGTTEPQSPVASSGSDFEWSNAGIGIGVAALLVAGTAGALVVRSRQHGSLAH
jgi:hypothetical protein